MQDREAGQGEGVDGAASAVRFGVATATDSCLQTPDEAVRRRRLRHGMARGGARGAKSGPKCSSPSYVPSRTPPAPSPLLLNDRIPFSSDVEHSVSGLTRVVSLLACQYQPVSTQSGCCMQRLAEDPVTGPCEFTPDAVKSKYWREQRRLERRAAAGAAEEEEEDKGESSTAVTQCRPCLSFGVCSCGIANFASRSCEHLSKRRFAADLRRICITSLHNSLRLQIVLTHALHM